jgi:hypothetical protein
MSTVMQLVRKDAGQQHGWGQCAGNSDLPCVWEGQHTGSSSNLACEGKTVREKIPPAKEDEMRAVRGRLRSLADTLLVMCLQSSKKSLFDLCLQRCCGMILIELRVREWTVDTDSHCHWLMRSRAWPRFKRSNMKCMQFKWPGVQRPGCKEASD